MKLSSAKENYEESMRRKTELEEQALLTAIYEAVEQGEVSAVANISKELISELLQKGYNVTMTEPGIYKVYWGKDATGKYRNLLEERATFEEKLAKEKKEGDCEILTKTLWEHYEERVKNDPGKQYRQYMSPGTAEKLEALSAIKGDEKDGTKRQDEGSACNDRT